MGSVFLVAGLGGVVAAWGAYLTDAAIERSGARAVAQLDQKFIVGPDDGDHVVRYRFQPAEGPAIDTTLSIGTELWQDLREGQSLEIRYDADNPKRNFPAGAGVASPWLAVFITTLAGPLGLFGGALLWRSLRVTDAAAR